MSNIRRLLESMDKIAEAGPKGLQRPGLEMGYEMGGGGLGAGGAKVWRSPRTGQTSSTPPGGTTVAQPLPTGMTPSSAGAGRGTINPVTAKPRIQRLPGETPIQAIARAQAATPKPSVVAPTPAPAHSGLKDPSAAAKYDSFMQQRKNDSAAMAAKIKPPMDKTVPTIKPTVDPVGQARPGGERDIYGRREPSGMEENNNSIEKKLRKNRYMKETVIEKMLNDFTKFVEDTANNKSKEK